MKDRKGLSVSLLLLLVFACLTLCIGCSDRLPPMTVADKIDSGIDVGKPNLNADATFNLFSELVPNGDIVFDTDTTLDAWAGSGSVIEEVTGDTGFGGAAWKFIYGSWLGVAIRFAEIGNTANHRRVDLTAYTNGYLNFMYKGAKWVKIGMMSRTIGGVETEAWLYPENLSAYGMRQDNTWCTIKVPLAHFTNLTWTEIFQAFILVADNMSGHGGASGDEHFVDEIFYSKE